MTTAPNPRPDEDWDDPAKNPQLDPQTHIAPGVEGESTSDTGPEGEDPIPASDDTLIEPNEETDTTPSQEPDDQGETTGLAEG